MSRMRAGRARARARMRTKREEVTALPLSSLFVQTRQNPQMTTARDAEDATKAMMLKDLRIECRARGVSPAGSRDDLLARVRENMVETGDW